ncbi:MAG TPA: Na/Pi cotransporter family protein [Candidatus Acutalibacter pullicola]|uniref:Na/Pi cotransporter family protein n=1 Tax=Candidatus Acutalibacter pullicola TaxID=2838417 RepID=A0A9D2MX55_9FIRM|nr:Na/Pi cotransporter family protein [Candidatus Acutalibacter pullicola]
MTWTNVLALLGGLALFLYGMQMMSSGLEAAAGNRMKRILEKLTSNRILGVLVGAGITAVIQSSSATTVMVVGFVNSGMMTLRQAVWIIMGANIGTTITGQLIALDVGEIAPLMAFIGVALVVFIKKPTVRYWGQIVAGLGILFLGMNMMSDSMLPLRESEAFIGLMTQFSNPLLGILAGTVFTAVIQSSSASVGILQTLAKSGLIGLDSAVYVLFGQNIGTCITAVLASIGTSRNAKRTTIIHLLFNVIGTTLFTVVCMCTPLTSWVAGWTPDNPSAQIANMHTLFNVVTTLLLLPFGSYLASLATKILPEKTSEAEEAGVHRLLYIKPVDQLSAEHHVGTSAIVLNGVQHELARMAGMVRQNVDESFQAVLDSTPARLEKVEETEEYIDYLNKEISSYISHIIVFETNERDSEQISRFFKISSNLERIGDHAVNICEYTKMLEEKHIAFSQQAREEIQAMRQTSLEALQTLGELGSLSPETLESIYRYEQKIDDMTLEYRHNQMVRLREGACSDEACTLYSEMLTDFERIGDHILNIGQDLSAELTPALQKA